MQTLGKRLKWVRENRLGNPGFRALERLLAEHGIEASHNSIRRYEADARVPTVDYVLALAELAEVDITWMLMGAGDPDRPPSVEASQRAIQEVAKIVDQLRAAEYFEDQT